MVLSCSLLRKHMRWLSFLPELINHVCLSLVAFSVHPRSRPSLVSVPLEGAPLHHCFLPSPSLENSLYLGQEHTETTIALSSHGPHPPPHLNGRGEGVDVGPNMPPSRFTVEALMVNGTLSGDRAFHEVIKQR